MVEYHLANVGQKVIFANKERFISLGGQDRVNINLLSDRVIILCFININHVWPTLLFSENLYVH